MEIPKEAPKNKFIETNQLQVIFEFNNIPTFQKAIDKNTYFHISGEVLGAFYTGDNSVVAKNFRDKEYFFILKGYYKPICIIEVKDKTFTSLPETTSIKLDDHSFNDKNIYVIFDILNTRIDGEKSTHKKLMVSYRNLNKILYGSDIYTYEEIEDKILEEKYCESIKNRTFNIGYKDFPEIRKFYYYEDIFSYAKLAGVLKKAFIIFDEIDEEHLELVDRINNLFIKGIEKQNTEEIKNYITVPYAIEMIFKRISNSNKYTFNENMITKVKLINFLIRSITSNTLTAIERYTKIDFMVNHSKSIVIDNFISDILIDTIKFNKWLDKNYPIQKIKQEKKKSKEQIQRESVFKDYLASKNIEICSRITETILQGKTKNIIWEELEDYFLDNEYPDCFSGKLFDSRKTNTINAFFRDAKLCSFAK